MNIGILRKKVQGRVVNGNGRALSGQRVNEVIDAVFAEMVDTLAKGNEIRIASLGSFRVVPSAPRKGRNPKTGDSVMIPAGTRIVFKPAKFVRERVKRPVRRR